LDALKPDSGLVGEVSRGSWKWLAVRSDAAALLLAVRLATGVSVSSWCGASRSGRLIPCRSSSALFARAL